MNAISWLGCPSTGTPSRSRMSKRQGELTTGYINRFFLDNILVELFWSKPFLQFDFILVDSVALTSIREEIKIQSMCFKCMPILICQLVTMNSKWLLNAFLLFSFQYLLLTRGPQPWRVSGLDKDPLKEYQILAKNDMMIVFPIWKFLLLNDWYHIPSAEVYSGTTIVAGQ